jgi:MYND finger
MSFSDIRAARQSKQLKSLVSATTKNELPVADVEGIEHFQHELPSAIRMKMTPDKGRALYAEYMIEAGLLFYLVYRQFVYSFNRGRSITTLRPRVSVLSAPYLSLFCSSCCASFNRASFKRCSKCKILRYCNSDCQLGDWSAHKAECACLQRLISISSDHESAIPPDAVRCLGRILFLKQKRGLSSKLVFNFSIHCQ